MPIIIYYRHHHRNALFLKMNPVSLFDHVRVMDECRCSAMLSSSAGLSDLGRWDGDGVGGERGGVVV